MLEALTCALCSAQVYGRIQANFMWAMLYNVLCIPLAAGVCVRALVRCLAGRRCCGDACATATHACTHAHSNTRGRIHKCTHARTHAHTHREREIYTHASAHTNAHARARAHTHARTHARTHVGAAFPFTHIRVHPIAAGAAMAFSSVTVVRACVRHSIIF